MWQSFLRHTIRQ